MALPDGSTNQMDEDTGRPLDDIIVNVREALKNCCLAFLGCNCLYQTAPAEMEEGDSLDSAEISIRLIPDQLRINCSKLEQLWVHCSKLD